MTRPRVHTWKEAMGFKRHRRSVAPFLSPPVILPNIRWNPEERLIPLERRLISPIGFRSGVVLATDPLLIRYLDEHPQEVYSLTPREFEELVASLLVHAGYNVRMSALGSDGGVDLFAERKSEFGPEMTLVQCKRNRVDRRVGEPVVKQLYADVTRRNATRGLLVTTSTFTAPALAMIEDVRYRLAGKDIDRLKEWFHHLRRIKSRGDPGEVERLASRSTGGASRAAGR